MSVIVPKYFPRSLPECKDPVANFFKCFTDNSESILNNRSNLENKIKVDLNMSVSKCLKEMKLYESCMDKIIIKKPSKQYRVQDEYRVYESKIN
eukprot:gene13169-17644_t